MPVCVNRLVRCGAGRCGAVHPSVRPHPPPHLCLCACVSIRIVFQGTGLEVVIFGTLSTLFFIGACTVSLCRRRPRDLMIMAPGTAAPATDEGGALLMAHGTRTSDGADVGGARTMLAMRPTAADGLAGGGMTVPDVEQMAERQTLDGTQVGCGGASK